MIIGAYANYYRGQGKLPRALTAAIFTYPFAWLMWGNWHDLGVMFAAIWLFGFMPGWGRYVRLDDHPIDPAPEIGWIDWLIDKWEGDDLEKKSIGTALRGLYFTAPVVATALALGYQVNPIMAAFGLLMVVAYLVGYRDAKDATHGWGRGEWIWGGMLELIYIVTVLTAL